MPFEKILLNNEKNLELEKNGYAIIPFLNEEEIRKLTDFFYQYHTTLPSGMYASSHEPDTALRKIMNAEIQQACMRPMQEHLNNIQPLGATYMVKSKGENGSLQPHQDWSIVDENEFYSYNIWLPLVDTSTENGTLLILPDSHKLYKNIRGLNIASSFEKVISEVWEYLVPINVKAGEALVYDHRLLHASGINHTDTPRLVVVYGIIPKNASMRYYYGRNSEIEEYECTPEFYFSENILNGPNALKLLKIFPNTNHSVNIVELKKTYHQNTPLLKRLVSMFFK